MNKKFLDALMIFPSGGDLFFTNFVYHLGSAYIIAYLKKNGFDAEQFISEETYNVKECVKKILSHNPKTVGFTVYETNYMQCVLISKGLKAFNSEIIIIFGGPTPTIQYKEILESTNSVDLCVRGEGEEILLDLLTILSNNEFNLNKTDLHNIKGIAYKKENHIFINPESNILLSNRNIKNYLDNYPSPYITNVIPVSKAFPTGIITARGCNQNCIYCNCAILSKRNIFFHSIERVIQELMYINEYKKFVGPIPINDDTFTIIPTRAKKICEAIIENNIKIPLQGITRCDKINEELLDLMKQAGFDSIGFALESAIPRVLRTIGKVSAPENKNSENLYKEIEFIEKLKEMTLYAKKIGINKVFVSIMIGLPGESIQDAQKTIEFINQLDIDFYTHNFFHIFKGTPIYQNHKKYGYKINPIGKKNKIIIKNNFPFNVYQIKMAPNCAKIQHSKILDYDTLNILSLNLKRINLKSYFDNIIINSDIIKPGLVKWLQENLAINGAIIQIYTSKLQYLKLHEKNAATLYNEFSPTKYYESYFWENLDHTSLLKSGRMALFNDQVGLDIKVKDTNLALEEYKKGYNNMHYLLCAEHSAVDTRALCKLLIDILKSGDGFNYLLKSKPLPQFQNLCRWTANQANCQKLETALIGSDDSIRICWNSEPIGKIGDSFSDIRRNLQNLFMEKVEQRNCDICMKNESCLKCLYPHPLSSEEYCDYKRNYDTIIPAKFINAFNVLKEFLFKPINLLEF